MKFCSHCGNQLSDEAVICPSCGCSAEAPTAKKRDNNSDIFAVLGFVFSFISSVVGLVLSIIAYRSAVAENNRRNKNFAVAGIVISSVSIGCSVLVIVLYFGLFAALLSSPAIYI